MAHQAYFADVIWYPRKDLQTSFREGLYPENLKQALVRPRLKKITLDPDDLNSYRPISRYLTLHFCRRLLSEQQQTVSGVISSHINFSCPPLDPPVAMYHLENYCVRSAVYKIHAKHTLKRPRSHMGAVSHC